MIFDKLDMFSDATAVTATAISDVRDLGPLTGNTGRDIGSGEPLWLYILCTETAVSAGATTVTFSLESDSTADLATSATVHWTSAAIAKASLVAGFVVAKIAVPVGPAANYEKFLGIRYTVAVANLSAGKFTAALVRNVDTFRAYADAITIS